MTARTFNELFEPEIILSLAQAPGGWIVWDQACRYYVLAPHSLPFCLRFLKAGADRGDWLVDDDSVERACWADAQHSMRVDALPEREPSAVAPAGGGRATSPSRSESASNVYPIRKGA